MLVTNSYLMVIGRSEQEFKIAYYWNDFLCLVICQAIKSPKARAATDMPRSHFYESENVVKGLSISTV